MLRPLSLLAALSAGPAVALTCVPPDPIASFRMAHEAPESYVVLHGRLEVDALRFHDGVEAVPPGAAETLLDPVEARFRGFALGLAGLTTPVDATVLLQPQCLGQFCGRIGPGDGWLLFARPSGSGLYTVTVDPCGAWAFDGVAQGTLDTLAECLRGRAC